MLKKLGKVLTQYFPASPDVLISQTESSFSEQHTQMLITFMQDARKTKTQIQDRIELTSFISTLDKVIREAQHLVDEHHIPPKRTNSTLNRRSSAITQSHLHESLEKVDQEEDEFALNEEVYDEMVNVSHIMTENDEGLFSFEYLVCDDYSYSFEIEQTFDESENIEGLNITSVKLAIGEGKVSENTFKPSKQYELRTKDSEKMERMFSKIIHFRSTPLKTVNVQVAATLHTAFTIGINRIHITRNPAGYMELNLTKSTKVHATESIVVEHGGYYALRVNCQTNFMQQMTGSKKTNESAAVMVTVKDRLLDYGIIKNQPFSSRTYYIPESVAPFKFMISIRLLTGKGNISYAYHIVRLANRHNMPLINAIQIEEWLIVRNLIELFFLARKSKDVDSMSIILGALKQMNKSELVQKLENKLH
jgi:hypothetical protein